MASWWRSYIAQHARRLGLDPQAVLAIAAQEGLRGGVGDRGTSFGPFQLHVGGALPRGRGRAWAESPAGIDYALRQIAGVARGLHGAQAVSAISRRFERPANPAAEIAGALRAYGSGATGAGAPGAGLNPYAAPLGPAPGARQALAASLIAASQATDRGQQTDYAGLLSALTGLRQGGAGPAAAGPHVVAGPGPSKGRASLSYLEPFGKQFGLSVTSTTGGKHVPGSYHYQGRAVDFGGPAPRMMALMQYALHHPRQFTEAFYDPAGFYVKGGRVYQGSIGGHRNHVHLAK